MLRRRIVRTASALACTLTLASVAGADEGKWTPQQVRQLGPEWLRKQGLELPIDQLWDPSRGSGLLAAAVSLPGCSAAFVSSTGLILTNHHCLFSLIQEHSRPDRDLIANGFLARTSGDELPGKTMRVTVPRRFTDVTKAIEAAVPAGADGRARLKAIEAEEKALIAECERTPGTRCAVARFDGGLQYVLSEGLDLTDVRLVYAPPRAVAEFGGELENYRWPRHVGDFAIARVYKDGKPYAPEFFVPVSREGVKPGDFVMVLGYPGRSFRSLTASEMANERDFRFDLVRQVYGDWIRLIEERTAGSREGSLAVAATLKSLNNSHTNAQAQLAGLARGRAIEKQKASDEAVMTWAAGRPEHAAGIRAKAELDRLAAERGRTARRDYLFSVVPSGALALKHAAILVRLAGERPKPDAQRAPAYMERELPRLRAEVERDQKSFFKAADEALLASWIGGAQALGAGERIKAVDEAFGDAAAAPAAASLYGGTRVTDAGERLRMFGETSEQLRARHDPLLDFAFALDSELRAWREATETRDGAIARLRPEWRRLVIAHAGRPVAPDANSTLRVSFAHVRGYSPRDAVFFTPQTTLAGMIEKHTGEEPFDVPAIVREGAGRGDAADVPINFLADADTTGGNSGSPVLNARGELVGLNFDRVWENVANDFGYIPDVARNISVDVRFLLWLLHDVQKADDLVRELTAPR